MDTNKSTTGRRAFLRRVLVAGAGLALGGGWLSRWYVRGLLSPEGPGTAVDRAIRDHKLGQLEASDVQATVVAHMGAVPGRPRVVHVRDAAATHWSGSGWYGAAVDQAAVSTMLQRGLQQLTGRSTWPDIWASLFARVGPQGYPQGYRAGQKIAVKVNFNNANPDCADDDNAIDALPQPLVALVDGLKQAGVREQDVWIYDATKGGRHIPTRFRSPILAQYPGVVFYGNAACAGVTPSTFDRVDPGLEVRFADPHGNLSSRWLPDLLHAATYLIDLPILKRHGLHPVSLTFKNHFGSLNNIVGGGTNDLHRYIGPSETLYTATYSPLVDIYRNPNLDGKRVLVLGDGLYGAGGAREQPRPWSTFGGGYPNSLFFAVDPVAADCVMADLVGAEWSWGMDGAYDYLFCAQAAGLGCCEGTSDHPGGDPWRLPYGSGYNCIDYVRIDA